MVVRRGWVNGKDKVAITRHDEGQVFNFSIPLSFLIWRRDLQQSPHMQRCVGLGLVPRASPWLAGSSILMPRHRYIRDAAVHRDGPPRYGHGRRARCWGSCTKHLGPHQTTTATQLRL